MPFFKTFLRAFGFGNEDDYNDDEAPSALVTPYHKPQETVDSQPVAQPQEKPQSETSGEEFPLTFFDGILDVFNNAQPDFIKQCLDKEAQRRYLYDVLGASFKDFLTGIRKDAKDEVDIAARKDRDRFKSEIETLREKYKAIENKESDWEQQRLSADRQKRALNNKLHELEQKVLSLEAEKEQYELENRGLLNKIKVAGVIGADGAPLQQELDEARKVAQVATEKVAELQQEIERLSKESEDTAGQYKSRMAMSDQMLTDIRNQNQKSVKDAEIATAKLAELTAEHDAVVKQLKTVTAELDEANANLAIASDVQEKVAMIEAVLSDKDKRIKTLRKEKDDQALRIAELERANKILEENIGRTMREQAENEQRLKKAIEDLQAGTVPQPQERPKRRKKSLPKVSAIDESLDDVQWLVGTPPEGMVVKTAGTSSDAEFGYQEPARKNPPENSAQMSLF